MDELYKTEIKLMEIPTPQTLTFMDGQGKETGKLYLESPMRFEGDLEESAKVFFEHCIDRIEQERKDLRQKLSDQEQYCDELAKKISELAKMVQV